MKLKANKGIKETLSELQHKALNLKLNNARATKSFTSQQNLLQLPQSNWKSELREPQAPIKKKKKKK